mgnify:CR=1 FL=1
MAVKTALELLSEPPEYAGKTTLDLAVENYNLWFKANQALSLNKEYEISNGQNSKRKLTRADADEVQQNLLYWENEIGRLQDADPSAPKIRTIFTAGYPA